MSKQTANNRLLKKQVNKSTNVLDASLERIRYIFNRFDKVAVSFSGGKDSTVVLNLTLMVAKELGKLPLRVLFFDEEAIHPTTIDYVERVRNTEGVALEWYCLPFKHRNACSRKQPFWYCFNPDEEHLWVRQPPPFAIRTHPNFQWGMDIAEFSPFCLEKSEGNVCILTGIRAAESMRRLRTVLKRKRENYINQQGDRGFVYKAHPIYDWTAEDVWVGSHQFNWDYNRTYDIFDKVGVTLHAQRVCQPYGEEPLRGLWLYAECFPEMWHKMLYRVKGVATAWRYANTELYVTLKETPAGMSWKQYLEVVITNYNAEDQIAIRKNLNTLIRLHYKKSVLPISDDTPDPISGVSWKFLCKVAIKGDFKGRTQGSAQVEAEKQLKKLKIDYDEAVKRFGTPTHQQRYLEETRRASS